MRITIEHREAKTLNGNNYFVDCTVLFSEEEKAIIKARSLYNSCFFVPPATPNVTKAAEIGLPILQKVARGVWIVGVILAIFSVFTRQYGDLAGMLLFVGVPVDLYFLYANKKQDERMTDLKQQIRIKQLLDDPKITVWAYTPAQAQTYEEDIKARLNDLKNLFVKSAELPSKQTFDL